MDLLALSGSLRRYSYNTAALDALARVAPHDVDVSVFRGLGDLPLFNPDREDEPIAAVEVLKQAVSHADGLIIASPEYAHGITGVMKNALDWLVGGEEFINMPVMLVNTSPRAHHAMEALREVVTTMSGRIEDGACLTLPLLGSELGVDGILEDHALRGMAEQQLREFCLSVAHTKTGRFNVE